ncbi:MAG TPA: hypothetical protein VFG24_08505 [Nitrosopumilaceae archaeon]|nr:hypothetical protein [Nitrosopumilaceae archaeon]
MTIPFKNKLYEMIKESGSLTDSELSKLLIKGGISIPDDEFNKTLLSLEIYGLIKVNWLTKEQRRIEIVEKENEVDQIEQQSREKLERDYEAGFPGVDQEQEIPEEV